MNARRKQHLLMKSNQRRINVINRKIKTDRHKLSLVLCFLITACIVYYFDAGITFWSTIASWIIKVSFFILCYLAMSFIYHWLELRGETLR